MSARHISFTAAIRKHHLSANNCCLPSAPKSMWWTPALHCSPLSEKYGVTVCLRGRFPANTKHWTHVGLMLCRRRRRWANVNPTLVYFGLKINLSVIESFIIKVGAICPSMLFFTAHIPDYSRLHTDVILLQTWHYRSSSSTYVILQTYQNLIGPLHTTFFITPTIYSINT